MAEDNSERLRRLVGAILQPERAEPSDRQAWDILGRALAEALAEDAAAPVRLCTCEQCQPEPPTQTRAEALSALADRVRADEADEANREAFGAIGLAPWRGPVP